MKRHVTSSRSAYSASIQSPSTCLSHSERKKCTRIFHGIIKRCLIKATHAAFKHNFNLAGRRISSKGGPRVARYKKFLSSSNSTTTTSTMAAAMEKPRVSRRSVQIITAAHMQPLLTPVPAPAPNPIKTLFKHARESLAK